MHPPHNLGDLIPPGTAADKIAVIDLRDPGAPCEVTYGAIEAMICGIARMLAVAGWPAGTRIGVLSLNRVEYLAAYFAIMRAGLVAVPINTKLPDETVAFILEDAEVKFVFADAANAGRVAGLPVLGFDDGFAAALDPGRFVTLVPDPDDIAQQLYTSGSTGRPKGVPLSHESQLWALRSRAGAPGESEDRSIVAAPLFHMNGLVSAKAAFFTGASIVLLPDFSARRYLQAIARHRVTALTSVPTMLARVLKETDLLQSLDLSAVRRVGMGSAPITMALWDKVQAAFPNAPIYNSYGTTEAGPAVFGGHPDGRPTPKLSLGYPLPGGEVRLEGGMTPDEGVLMMRNPSLMTAYHKLPAQTEKALRDGWYYSGDVMRRDADGFFFFVGRADDMFVCSGENIYPGEVEKLLEQHPGVHQAAVVPLADEERGQMPVAFVVLRPELEVDMSEIKRFALAGGPAYQHPRRVEFMADLPLAGTNKVDRRALILRAAENEAVGGWSA